MASEKETIPKDDKKEDEPAKDTNGEKNGDTVVDTASAPAGEKQKLSLGEIAAVDGEIAKAKTEQLQVLHNLFYGKNGSGPQIKRGIRKFAGFEDGDKQKKLDQLLTYELAAIKQTATILDLQDVKKDEVKETVAKAIIDFLMTPTGKTFEDVQKDEPAEEEELSEPEEEEEEEIKVKPKKGRGGANSAARPKRATASRVWTNDYGSSEEEEIEEARPRVGRKKRGDDSDSGSDYNPSGGGSDSEADRRKSARNATPARPTRGGRSGRRGRDSESEESEEESEEGSEEEVMPAKKKKASPPTNRATPKRGAAQKGRKRKPETESEEEVSEDGSEEPEAESEDSEKQKKSPRKVVTPKSTPQKKNSKGRPAKRAAPPAAKKKRKDVSSDEEEPEEDASEDDEPLKKPPTKKGGSTDGAPTDDDIKKLLKDILAEANLEEITMKTVCKKVYAHYPNHDLSQRKDFIKQTVKSLIAA